MIGDNLTYEAFELPSDLGLTLLVYTAEPATPSHDALNLLASWAATLDDAERAEPAHATDEAVTARGVLPADSTFEGES